LPVRVRVELLPEGESREVVLERGTVGELLARLGLGREGGVVVKDGRPLVEDEVLSNGDRVRVYRAASGG
jgi:sulfur carrier protein